LWPATIDERVTENQTVAVLEGKIFAFGGERLGGTFNQTEACRSYNERLGIAYSNQFREQAPSRSARRFYIPTGGTLNDGTAQTNGNQAFSLK
jgi:hypothetical protein